MNRKPLFEAIRKILGRGLVQSEVDYIDRAIDEGFNQFAGEHETCRISQAGIDLIKRFEGFAVDLGNGKVKSYPDPATGGKPYTIGWGTTGPDVTRDTVWTHEEAELRFRDHIAEFEGYVRKLTPNTTQSQFDALVSLCYNVGPANFERSSLRRLHNGGDYRGAADEFPKWRFANGRPMPGLINRRKAERPLYLS